MAGLSRRGALRGAVGAAAFGVAGCSAPEAPPSPSPTPTLASSSAPPTRPVTPSPSPSPSPSVDTRPRWPLTGQLVKDPALLQRSAVAVKIPDNKNEHPQEGLNEADLVFVQLDGYYDAQGYSSTRLMPVYHSQWAVNAAPVRSQRPVDVPLLAPMHAVVGSSGGADWVEKYVAQHADQVNARHVYIKSKGTGAYSVNRKRIYKTRSGRTEYDRALVCHPEGLAALAKFGPAKAALYLPFCTGDQTPSTLTGTAANHVGVAWKGDGYIMGYDYDPATKTYLRSMPWGPHVLMDGARVTCHNVLVIQARQYRDKLTAGGGGQEPIHGIIEAKGAFTYAHGGKAVKGIWSKAGVAAPFVLTLADGTPLRVAPGRTFVELPSDKAVVTLR